MKKIKLIPILFLLSSILVSCASSYKSINPQQLSYTKDNSSAENVQFEYHYNVLTESKNNKYSKKEAKSGIQVVSLKVTNNTENDLEHNKSYQLYSGDNVLNALPNETLHAQLKQQAPLHLLYLLLAPVKLYMSTATSTGTMTTSNTSTFPLGLILAPGLALGNFIVATSANAKFKNELSSNSIFNRVIKKGESAYFIIGIKSTSFQPISLKLMNKTTKLTN